ncbi:hypothetical protein S83_043653 [Arachis hypogaea]
MYKVICLCNFKSEPPPLSPLFCLLWSLLLPSSPALAAGLSASPGVILSLSPSLVYSQYLSSLFASFASVRHRSLCCRRGTRIVSFSIVILSKSASSFSASQRRRSASCHPFIAALLEFQ